MKITKKMCNASNKIGKSNKSMEAKYIDAILVHHEAGNELANSIFKLSNNNDMKEFINTLKISQKQNLQNFKTTIDNSCK